MWREPRTSEQCCAPAVCSQAVPSPGLFTEAQGCGSSSLAPRAQPMPQLAPSSFCTLLCSRALEARRAACPTERDVSVFSASVSPRLSLCLCGQAELALLCSLSCSSAARAWEAAGPPAPGPAEGAGSPLGLEAWQGLGGLGFPSAGTVCTARPWDPIPYGSHLAMRFTPCHA